MRNAPIIIVEYLYINYIFCIFASEVKCAELECY